MTALFRNRWLRLPLLVAVMGLAFWLGQVMRSADVAAIKSKHLGSSSASGPAQSVRSQSPDDQYRVRPEAQLTNFSVGKFKVSVDQMGNYYIDGLNISEMMMMEPDRAMAMLAKLPMGDATVAAYLSAFKTWAGANTANGAKASAAAFALPPGPAREAALQGVATGWAWDNPKDALTWASTLPPADSAALKNALISASQKDPALAAQYIGNLTNASARSDAILAISNAWSGSFRSTIDTDPAAALAWLDQVATGTTYDNAVKDIFSNLAQTNPAAAAALIANITDPSDRSAAIAQTVARWLTKNPQDALSWAASLPDTDAVARATAVQSIVANWSGKNLSDAIAYAQSNLSPEAMLAVTPTFAKAMAKTDPQAALNWVNTLPDSTAKDQSISTILVGVASSDFQTAWAYTQTMPDGTGRTAAMDSLVATLSKTNAAQAASLLGTGDSNMAVKAIATNWAKQDPTAAAAWITSLPPGNNYDNAATSFAQAQKTKDPASAFTFANTIANNNSRSYYVSQVINSWATKDPAAALAAVQSANISDKARAVLIQNINVKAGK